MDEHYPTIEMDFVHNAIINSPKIAGYFQIGETFAYVINGTKPVGKRTVYLRVTDGQVGFLHASGLAIRLGFLTSLLTWLEERRNWKDGAYIVQPEENVENNLQQDKNAS